MNTLLAKVWLMMLPGLVHPIHISVTEIEYDTKDKALEIMTRIWIDDLEEAIRDRQKDRTVNLLNPSAGVTTDQLVSSYLEAHFRVSLDGKVQRPNYLGHERDGDALICFLEIGGVKKWKLIEVMNDVIMEVYDDQSNIVHVTVGETVKSLRLTESNPSGKLPFNL